MQQPQSNGHDLSLDSASTRLGIVVAGSVASGLDIKLDAGCSVEEMAVGRFVTIQGNLRRFFGVITDVSLAVTDERLAATPPDVSDPFIAEAIAGTSAYGAIHVAPYLSAGADSAVVPAKTVPPHFSIARNSHPLEVQLIFGENDDRHVWIGSPLDMDEAPVCLDIQKLIERSTGVFGKTGTGKSFLTRILLADTIHKTERWEGRRAPVSLIFDMHREYGWGAASESGLEVKGLKQLFSSRVAVFSLDPESARRRGVSPDFTVRIGFEDIEADDVATLADTLGLSEAMVQAAYRLEKRQGTSWVVNLLEAETLEDLAGGGAFEHEATLSALRRKLEVLERFQFLGKGRREDETFRQLFEYLNDGRHVVLDFGSYSDNLTAYILVANLLTRRLHQRYVEMTEKAQGRMSEAPRPLVIVLEEAHKFLSPDLASKTIFGTIARELRKYSVTLLVVDQRPSGIDGEIMSQLGSKVTCLLENDRDIDAILTGVSGGRELRAVLAKLESRQQALIFGHAVPMPVVVRTRTYDAAFYRSVGLVEGQARRSQVARDIDDLFGPRKPI